MKSTSTVLKLGFGIFGFWLALGAGCSGSTSGNDALNQVSSAFCARAASCCAGVAQSTCQSEVSNTYKSVGFDTSKDVTSDSVNKCTGEIKALACPASACIFTVPPDCPGPGALLPIGASLDAGSQQDSATGGNDGGSEQDSATD